MINMPAQESILRAISAFPLPQGRFKNGQFYVSVCSTGGEPIGIDIRFFVEEGDDLTPTKIGFRLPQDGVAPLLNALAPNPTEIGDIVCIELPNRRFHIRYVNDKYGESVDYRWYQTTDKFEGWTRSGFRVPTDVYQEFRQLLIESNLLSPDSLSKPDLLEGKNIISKSKRSGDSASRGSNAAAASPPARQPYVTDVLDDLLK